MKKTMLLACAFLIVGSRLVAQEDVAMKAMHDEMQRSLKELHLNGTQVPYYISYKITETEKKDAQATLGSLLSSSETHTRLLTVDVRVGDYQMDSSNYVSSSSGLLGLLGGLVANNAVLPLDDNYEELRRTIWLTTDKAYKKALEDYAAKKAAFEKRGRSDNTPDFSKEPARQESELLPVVEMKLADMERMVRAASVPFKNLDGVEISSATLQISNVKERFLNSEGTNYVRQIPNIFFHATANRKTSEGKVFTDSVSNYARSIHELPAEPELVKETSDLVSRMMERTHNSKQYAGPVLFEDDAAAQIFSANFGNLLAARSKSATEITSVLSILLSGRNSHSTANMLNKIGSRVLPEFLTVIDNPLAAQAEGKPLMGGYKFDEEGTPAQETVLVKDGFLKTLLNSRTPARGLPQSTGNMREHGILPSNMFVQATKTSSPEEMKKKLLDMVKARGLEYGMIFRRMGNGNAGIEAYRLLPDGHEELLRYAKVSEFSYSNFKDIVAVSAHENVYTTRSGGASLMNIAAAATGDLVTYVVPDLLFEDVSVEHSSTRSSPPAIPSPLQVQ